MTGAGKPQILRKSHAVDRCFPDRAATEDGEMRIDAVPYDHPDAVRLILETGSPQPEAVALYRSAGYAGIPAYGYYACSPHSMHFGKVLRR